MLAAFRLVLYELFFIFLRAGDWGSGYKADFTANVPGISRFSASLVALFWAIA